MMQEQWRMKWGGRALLAILAAVGVLAALRVS